MNVWKLLCCAIVVEVGASLAMQAAINEPAWYVLVVLGYTAGFLLLVRILKLGMAIGVAYGIWGASGVALTALLAALIFGQRLTTTSTLGLALIAAGVVIVEWGSQAAGKPRQAGA
ncbi:QacE family quaternary ammonium compound efflux SMR transporter [Rhodococcus sp. 05-340-1]|uniref:DMT family transporter n=1 Tax=Nocardiaceae TaxID=85025 RepID=UPI00050C37F9|nr:MULTISPECIES: SMR family transporter [Rhodococcus]OZC87706.1 QacE family quaternary ammonium compound efflux SMR transporter [Rhodococcus sp. 06-412-2C]OZC96357.1 QacE family quaternary ammonium compound efflux SMR transporter [Rhodococcus sp. 06-412-2B]OZD65341.1 QacE family quaternary ammonium compound efflux SMR transporter [Rhodococcus sp. 05-340-2]OZD74613.1 QacE family quaternary ammonium compound efflux SMR transporter [Rhodococcus sp. 05-340-1]OZD86614.1 QacE family quaternary ammon